ncbi:MAG: hypothetical protein B7Z08_01450 [Sphingomonadales bacterium 32-68-7]|nr:MAG: hypothetical protein B7Z33_08785 [Sphingomonadales bacterium 12-68-11]OYX10387.1 MAG: hypothetical protein B7Z08_01450 [Sphingomonadales bacterium 32-68-7]
MVLSPSGGRGGMILVVATYRGITMMKMFLRAGAALLAVSATSANAASILDYYTTSYTKAIDTKEASAVAYNWDTRTLMVTNDEEEDDGTNIWGEYDRDGNKTATILLSGCLSLGSAQCDPEGLTYVGGGQYVVGEERYQDIALLSEIGSAPGTRSYTPYQDAPTISIGPDAGNSGLEGIAYNRVTGDYFGVKERQSETIWKISGANFGTETASVSTLFNAEALPGMDRLSDVAVLSNSRFWNQPFGENLLILSGRSFKILEVTQTGTVVGSLDLSGFKSLVDPRNTGGKFEGLTLDEEGNIYLVSDDGDNTIDPQSFLVKLGYSAPVPEPETWALMILGFGLIGGAMRRRRGSVAFG